MVMLNDGTLMLNGGRLMLNGGILMLNAGCKLGFYFRRYHRFINR